MDITSPATAKPSKTMEMAQAVAAPADQPLGRVSQPRGKATAVTANTDERKLAVLLVLLNNSTYRAASCLSRWPMPKRQTDLKSTSLSHTVRTSRHGRMQALHMTLAMCKACIYP
jgi:hypothetical protein